MSRGAPRQKYAGKGLQPSLLFRAYAACPGPIRFANKGKRESRRPAKNFGLEVRHTPPVLCQEFVRLANKKEGGAVPLVFIFIFVPEPRENERGVVMGSPFIFYPLVPRRLFCLKDKEGQRGRGVGVK